MHLEFDASHPSGIGTHDLQHLDPDARDIIIHAIGFNGHSSHHAISQAGGQQVGRGETVALAMVVHRGIGLKTGTAFEVSICGSESAFINYSRGHYE